jgi:hypothetical protein
VASFRAPFYFITFGLIPYRQSFCTLLYYSAAGGRRARPGGGLPPPVPAQTRGSLRAVVECAGVCITRMQPPQVSLQLDTHLCLSRSTPRTHDLRRPSDAETCAVCTGHRQSIRQPQLPAESPPAMQARSETRQGSRRRWPSGLLWPISPTAPSRPSAICGRLTPQ